MSKGKSMIKINTNIKKDMNWSDYISKFMIQLLWRNCWIDNQL